MHSYDIEKVKLECEQPIRVENLLLASVPKHFVWHAEVQKRNLAEPSLVLLTPDGALPLEEKPLLCDCSGIVWAVLLEEDGQPPKLYHFPCPQGGLPRGEGLDVCSSLFGALDPVYSWEGRPRNQDGDGYDKLALRGMGWWPHWCWDEKIFFKRYSVGRVIREDRTSEFIRRRDDLRRAAVSSARFALFDPAI